MLPRERSDGTRFVAADVKATKRPSGLTTGATVQSSAAAPASLTLAWMVRAAPMSLTYT
jgi:hypothetical protein